MGAKRAFRRGDRLAARRGGGRERYRSAAGHGSHAPPEPGTRALERSPHPQESGRVRVRVRRRTRLRRRELLRRRILLLAGILGALLVADGAWAVVQAVSGLTEARSQIREGGNALLAGRLDDARAAFEEAREAAHAAGAGVHHPAALAADILPGVGDDVDAAQALASSAENVAVGGGRLVDAAEASGWDGSGIPGLVPSHKGETEEEAADAESEDPGGAAEPSTPPDRTSEQSRASGQPRTSGQSPSPGVGTGQRGRGGPSLSPAPGRGRGVSSVRAGKVRLQVLRLARPHLADAAASLAAADRDLRAVDATDLWGPVSDALTEARAEVGPRARLVRSIADLTGLLPGFLGGEEPRTYFLAFQNLAAPRGSGGFLGVYGLLTARKGRLEIERMAEIQELADTQRIDAPRDYAKRYGRFGGLTAFLASNYSPDFPTTARVLLEMYRSSGRGSLDGVIAVDPLWAAYTLEAADSIETAAWPEPLTAENVSGILHHDVFTLERTESDEAQIALGKALLEGLLSQPLNPRALADGLSRAARERHLQLYSNNPQEQGFLGQLGVSGAVRMGPQPLFVVWQDATAAKAGYFAHKAVEQRVVLTPDGTAQVTSVITLDNRAPDGPPGPLLGLGTRGDGDPVGFFAAYVNVYLPEEAVNIKSKIPGSFALGLVEREFGVPVATELMTAGPGEETQLILTYEVPHAVTDVGGLSEYRLDFLPQPSLRPERLTIEFALPAGTELVTAGAGLERDGGMIQYVGQSPVPRSFWVRYQPVA